MISETFRRLLEHFPDHAHAIPFVVAATRFDDDEPSFRLDTKTLFTALIIALVTGAATAAWATYSTTKELSIQFSYVAKQIAETQVEVARSNAAVVANQLAVAELKAKVETMHSMSGMQGNQKR